MENNVKVGQQGLYINPGMNPIPGVTANLPLNASGGNPQAGMTGNLEQIKNIISEIETQVKTGKSPISFVPLINQAITKVSDENLINMLKSVANSLQFNSDVQSDTQNNAIRMLTPEQALQQVTQYINNLEQFTKKKSTGPNMMNTNKTAQVFKKKKKSRGNPFKVLMLLISKMLINSCLDKGFPFL